MDPLHYCVWFASYFSTVMDSYVPLTSPSPCNQPDNVWRRKHITTIAVYSSPTYYCLLHLRPQYTAQHLDLPCSSSTQTCLALNVYILFVSSVQYFRKHTLRFRILVSSSHPLITSLLATETRKSRNITPYRKLYLPFTSRTKVCRNRYCTLHVYTSAKNTELRVNRKTAGCRHI
jgi:hypothetical protein